MKPQIRLHGGAFELRASVHLSQDLDVVFNFFSDARNLELLTPPMLNFSTLTESPIVMKVGALIDYRLKIRGIPLRWRTEITAWDPPHRFEDTQLKGPYRQWIHEHAFVDEGDTTLMQDMVRYKVLGGRLVHALLVKRDVVKIFGYRKQVLRDLWGDPDRK